MCSNPSEWYDIYRLASIRHGADYDAIVVDGEVRRTPFPIRRGSDCDSRAAMTPLPSVSFQSVVGPIMTDDVVDEIPTVRELAVGLYSHNPLVHTTLSNPFCLSDQPPLSQQ